MGILIGFVIGAAFAVICVLVANAKGRKPWLWGILGFFFGFITLIVIAVLEPNDSPDTGATGRGRSYQAPAMSHDTAPDAQDTRGETEEAAGETEAGGPQRKPSRQRGWWTVRAGDSSRP